MKRYLIFMVIFVMAGIAANAQRLDITMDDNSVISYDINKIKSMEFMPEAEPGQIDGYWYLGWRVMSSSSKNLNGEERWVFNGTVLRVIKATGDEEIYDLTYADNLKSFKAQSRTSGTTITYTIIARRMSCLC